LFFETNRSFAKSGRIVQRSTHWERQGGHLPERLAILGALKPKKYAY
jgi:hypothetical protein